LQEKLKQLEDGRPPTAKDDVEVEKLHQQLTDHEADIKRLEEEKQALKSALESARDTQSQFSSPVGSLDNLKKRDSISSVGSARETASLCRRAVNSNIINKWHCLVQQVQHDHKRRMVGTQKSSSASSIHKQRHLTQGAIEAASTGADSSSVADVSNSAHEKSHQSEMQGSQHDLCSVSDDHSQATDDDSRSGRSSHRSSNMLKLPDSRRSTAKSPSRSPQPSRSQHLAASGKRPAWRL